MILTRICRRQVTPFRKTQLDYRRIRTRVDLICDYPELLPKFDEGSAEALQKSREEEKRIQDDKEAFDAELEEYWHHKKWPHGDVVAALGQSPLAKRYAIRDLEEAEQYLADPVLGTACVKSFGSCSARRENRHWRYLDRRTTCCFAKQPLKKRIVRFSRMPWINSMVASQTAGPLLY